MVCFLCLIRTYASLHTPFRIRPIIQYINMICKSRWITTGAKWCEWAWPADLRIKDKMHSGGQRKFIPLWLYRFWVLWVIWTWLSILSMGKRNRIQAKIRLERLAGTLHSRWIYGWIHFKKSRIACRETPLRRPQTSCPHACTVSIHFKPCSA